ncbi:diaminobutyrate acetyltransferase [Microbacterium sp. Mu-80]|uniref:L-2,4-diaminobutyric acid acetyltransferase n=1 Tax=Microbacterium bandirmense TaxID=3122050 RepID=A0ABU8LAW6_9MICO
MTTFNEATHAHQTALDPARITIIAPAASHGAGMWRVAGAAGELDLNSSYMYLVFARDFADTCRVALEGDDVVAFVLGYRRPEHPDRLFVWQVAVDAQHRGAGLAGRLLDDLIDTAGTGDVPLRCVETTITDDNTASQRLFAGFAARRGAALETTALFDAQDFPDQHDAERLHRIGPFPPSQRD